MGGINAVEKIKPILRKYFIVKTCHLPVGKDPQDCTRKEIEEAMKNASNGG